MIVRQRARWLCALLTALLLLSCGGSASKPGPVENPYTVRAKIFINGGMEALQQERWAAAEREFSQALLAAQLADNAGLINQSWYNIGVARAAMGKQQSAEAAYRRAIELANRHADHALSMRSRLAITLLRLQMNEPAALFPMQELFEREDWPADIYLQAARIAQLQHQPEQAEQAYSAVLARQGTTRDALKMKAEAHMGLALLARDAGDTDRAHRQADEALAICHRIGTARLTAHALLFKGKLSPPAGEADRRQYQLERALDIYSVLQDINGQRQSLKQLQKLAEAAGDKELMQRIQLRLQELDDKLVE